MDIKNILIAGSYEEEFKRHGFDQFPYTFRFKTLEEIKKEDILWTDVYVGSKPVTHLNLSSLKWVHSFNAGVNNFLELEGWFEHDVLLTRTICSFGQRISEYCLSYVLRDLQFHQTFQEKQCKRTWQQQTPKMLKDQTIVVFGTGEIGQEVAKSFSFLGASVYGVSKSGNHKQYFKEIVNIKRADELTSKADYIINTLPLTKETSNLFDYVFFNLLSDTVFINVGRGGTVNEPDLIKALNDGRVRLAVLDVVTEEPLPQKSELWTRTDVIITPHISAVTELNEAVQCFFETLKKVERNESLHNRVDLQKGY